jgi:BMFP domain-containing protein YqiC
MPQKDEREMKSARLHADAKDARLRAIQSQLALGSTLCELAETEIRIGELDAAQKLAAKLRYSADTIRFQLDEPHYVPETSVDLRGQLSQLEMRLENIEARLASPP